MDQIASGFWMDQIARYDRCLNQIFLEASICGICFNWLAIFGSKISDDIKEFTRPSLVMYANGFNYSKTMVLC